jgi:hypothetical protein
MAELIRQLSELIRREYPTSEAKFESFASGAAMLDVKVGAETWVLEFLPSLNAVGVSKLNTATFGWEGFEHHFQDFGSAKEFLLQMLSNCKAEL